MVVPEENESLRQTIISRLEKTIVIRRHLATVLRKTENPKQTVLTNPDLEELGIKLSPLHLERSFQNDAIAFYKPLPLSDMPVFDWDRVQFSEWTEGYSEESRRVDITLQNLSNRLCEAWLQNNKEYPLDQWT
ncbi:hypothetical protein BBP40_007924 [Aspergillus hancockii]|nr:hypothetical protein BBP40_007924 [Aspergillus hancockii]